MANTYKKIQTYTVGFGGISTISLTNIPQLYTDLYLLLSARSTTTGDYYRIRPNGASTNLTGVYLRGSGTATSGNTFEPWAYTADSSQTANGFAYTSIYIGNYSNTNLNKSMIIDNVQVDNDASQWNVLESGLWSSTSAITSLDLVMNSGSFAEYSTATLYGIETS